MDRIAARGHGYLTPMTALEALAIAAATQPQPLLASETLEGDPALGETVSITPIDYGRDNPSVGTLVSIDAQRLAPQHAHERTGLVTVHFPRLAIRCGRCRRNASCCRYHHWGAVVEGRANDRIR